VLVQSFGWGLPCERLAGAAVERGSDCREIIDTRPWPTRAGLHRAAFEYIEDWYNTRRLHSTLSYMSPAEYEAIHRNADRRAA
jgi:transposase InsO family protein